MNTLREGFTNPYMQILHIEEIFEEKKQGRNTWKFSSSIRESKRKTLGKYNDI